MDLFGNRGLDALAHLSGGKQLRSFAAMQISRAITLFQYLADGGFNVVGLLVQSHAMAQQHGYSGNRTQRISDILAGDVGSRAMDGLIKSYLASDSGRSQHSQRAGNHSSFVGEDISKEVLGYDHIKAAGI